MPFAKDQITLDYLYLNFLYTLGALAVILIVLALGLVDMGLVRRKNVLDTWVQKLTAALIAGGATILGGYGIWQWSFNQAFGVEQPLWNALKDWWIGGRFQTTFAADLDPADPARGRRAAGLRRLLRDLLDGDAGADPQRRARAAQGEAALRDGAS